MGQICEIKMSIFKPRGVLSKILSVGYTIHTYISYDRFRAKNSNLEKNVVKGL